LPLGVSGIASSRHRNAGIMYSGSWSRSAARIASVATSPA
jgi:hypothetical protein